MAGPGDVQHGDRTRVGQAVLGYAAIDLTTVQPRQPDELSGKNAHVIGSGHGILRSAEVVER